MAFSWVQSVSIGASIDAADINEIKTNIDSIYTYLSLTRAGCTSGAGWTVIPVSVGNIITSAQFKQLRDVADYAYDRRCTTNWASYDSGFCNLNYSGYCSTNYETVDSPDYATDCGYDKNIDRGSHDSGNCSYYDSYVL